jgi:hypothetical protein
MCAASTSARPCSSMRREEVLLVRRRVARCWHVKPPYYRCAGRLSAVIARSVATKQSRAASTELDCFALLAMTRKMNPALAAHARPSYAQAIPKKESVARIERSEIRGRRSGSDAAPGFRCAQPGLQNKKGSETPADAFVSMRPHHTDAAAHPAGCARLSAFHHGACCGDRTPQLNSRYALPGTELRRSGRYPPPAVPVQRASRRPVVMPAGRMTPEPPGSGGDEPPPVGTALAPPAEVTGWRPLRERD